MLTDVVVVGGGPAGENVADHVTRNGLDAIVVERELLGGECSYWACMPSKALLGPPAAVATARRIEGAAAAASGTVDVGAVLKRRNGFASNWDDAGQVSWLESADVRLVRGHGRLRAARRVEVSCDDGDEHDIEARVAVVLCTGSTPMSPPVEGLAEVETWGSRDATTATVAPRRLGVLGGGAVGLEMAQAWSRLGSEEVHVIEVADRLLVHEEPMVGETIAGAFLDEGIEVLTGASVDLVERRDDGLVLHIGQRELEVDELLVATGRRPALDDVGLDAIGLDPGTVEIDDQRRVVGVDGGWLYAVGDASGEVLLTHQGKYEARLVGEAIARGGRLSFPGTDIGPPRVVFTDPEVAAVGRTAQHALADGMRIATASVELGSVAGGALREDAIRGGVSLVVDRERNVVVGATFVGPGVAEMLHAATIAIVAQVPLDTLRHAVPAFPTVSEVWLRLLEELTEPGRSASGAEAAT